MTRKLWIWGCLAAGALGIAVLVSKLGHPTENIVPVAAQQLPVTAKALIGGETIELEVASTFEEQTVGLRFRDSLPANRGMLFELPRPRAQVLWTKDVNFPIDAVFLLDGTVEMVLSELPPCSGEPCPVYGVSKAVDQVLELPGGRAAGLGLVPGKEVRIQQIEHETRG
ncbi:MAG: DUF192 domain-containing protein [Cyanobacteria bacterium P01_F01_bin.13]